MWHRSPAVAGTFYPADPDELNQDIDSYLDAVVEPKIDEKVFGLISPHAGYIYSGPVAAYSYKQLIGTDIELVVVLAPSHRSRFEGASVIPEGLYETPLGEVQIDSILGKKIIEADHFAFLKDAHSIEHSLEVQVPFLQKVLGKFSIVPIIVGSINDVICRQIANELALVLKEEKRRFVIVISTDLSHYYTYNDAKRIDSVFVEKLEKFDIDGVQEVLSVRKAEACGEGPILTGMQVCRELGAGNVKILKYANSGDTAGGKEQVVGYLSAVLY